MDSASNCYLCFHHKISDNMGKGTHFFQTAGIWTANKMLKQG